MCLLLIPLENSSFFKDVKWSSEYLGDWWSKKLCNLLSNLSLIVFKRLGAYEFLASNPSRRLEKHCESAIKSFTHSLNSYIHIAEDINNNNHMLYSSIRHCVRVSLSNSLLLHNYDCLYARERFDCFWLSIFNFIKQSLDTRNEAGSIRDNMHIIMYLLEWRAWLASTSVCSVEGDKTFKTFTLSFDMINCLNENKY